MWHEKRLFFHKWIFSEIFFITFLHIKYLPIIFLKICINILWKVQDGNVNWYTSFVYIWISKFNYYVSYLSIDTAHKLYTEAATETPWIYGTTLHITFPRIHAESINTIENFELKYCIKMLKYDQIHFNWSYKETNEHCEHFIPYERSKKWKKILRIHWCSSAAMIIHNYYLLQVSKSIMDAKCLHWSRLSLMQSDDRNVDAVCISAMLWWK